MRSDAWLVGVHDVSCTSPQLECPSDHRLTAFTVLHRLPSRRGFFSLVQFVSDMPRSFASTLRVELRELVHMSLRTNQSVGIEVHIIHFGHHPSSGKRTQYPSACKNNMKRPIFRVLTCRAYPRRSSVYGATNAPGP